MSFTMDAKDKAMFEDLRRHHLRHPGTLHGNIARLLKLDTVTFAQICAARLEWRSLGLDKSPSASTKEGACKTV